MARLNRAGAGAGRKLARRSAAKYLSPMLKLLKLAALLGLVAGVLFLLPFGGRTLFDRWRAAHGASDFAARTWAEMRGSEPPAAPAAPRKGKAGKPAETSGPQPAPDQPLETTTDADRKALDKLLDRHLAEKPKR
jgi:hypothetical protein